MKQTGLGKGLEALFNENMIVEETPKENILTIDINDITPNPYQPRKNFNEDKILELAESIKSHGIFQPIIVRKSLTGYEIVSGERRYRASKKAGKETIPVIVCDYDDQQMMEIGMIENIQREDLNVVEEAKGYKMIMDNLSLTQEVIAKRVGKSRSHIANTLRILVLKEETLNLLENNIISLGHAKVLVNIEDQNKLDEILKVILKENLNVRQTEELVKNFKKTKKIVKQEDKNLEYINIEKILREKFGTKVNLKGKNKGKIEIEYLSKEDLERILSLIGASYE